MFSTESGLPIGKIMKFNSNKPKKDRKYLRLIENTVNKEFENKAGVPFEFFDINDLSKKFKTRKVKTLNTEYKKLKNRYEKDKSKLPEGVLGQGFQVHEGQLQTCPILSDEITRNTIYVTGASGSGKSYYTAMYCRNYLEMLPENRAYYYSAIPNDPKFLELEQKYPDRFYKIVLDDYLYTEIMNGEVPDLDLYADTLVIFDDCDSYHNKVVKEYVDNLRNEILNTGRHSNISCIVCHHEMYGYGKTKEMLRECSTYVLLTKGTPAAHGTRLLTEQFGCDKDKIEFLLRRTGSYWVQLCKQTSPCFAMFSSGAIIL